MVGFCYAVALVFFFANSVVFVRSSEKYNACELLFNETLTDMKCCESKILFDDNSESSNCKNSNSDEDLTCDDYKCLLEEDELLVGDKISDEKVNKMLDEWEKEYPKEKKMVDRARRECLGGKYLEYVDDEECAPLQFYTCLYINTVLECPTWKKDDQCTKMKGYAEKCKELQDSV